MGSVEDCAGPGNSHILGCAGAHHPWRAEKEILSRIPEEAGQCAALSVSLAKAKNWHENKHASQLVQDLVISTLQVVLLLTMASDLRKGSFPGLEETQLACPCTRCSRQRESCKHERASHIVQGLAMSTFQVVLVPTVLGVALNELFPKVVKKLKSVLPLIGVALTTLLCASPCAQVATILRWAHAHSAEASSAHNVTCSRSQSSGPV